MIIKASASLRNDYTTISKLAKETKEPIYITKNGEGDLVLMDIAAFEKIRFYSCGQKFFRQNRNELREKKHSVFQRQEKNCRSGQMKCKIEILPTAWEDLKKIEDYYLIQFDSETALKVSEHILDTIERLSEFPNSGSATPDTWLNEKGYRMVICKKHIAIYRQMKDIIYIYHIADTQTEYTKLFY